MPEVTEEYLRRLEGAKVWEATVYRHLKRLGYNAKLHTNYDQYGKETFQIYVYHGIIHSHPDFTVTKEENGRVIVEKYLEVKSYGRFYHNIGYVDFEVLDPNKSYVSIHKNQFEDYKLKQYIDEIATDIMFIIIGKEAKDNIYYCCDVDTLNNEKIEVTGSPYGKSDNCKEYYFWDKEILGLASEYYY